MTLEERITPDLKQAMIDKNQAELRSIRAIKAAIMLFKTSGTGEVLDGGAEIKILQKLVKSRKDSLDIYRQQNRPELASVEEEEIAIIERYLPTQMSAEAIEAVVAKVIADNGASGIKDMGKVMGMVSTQLAGQAEGKVISEIVKRMLSN